MWLSSRAPQKATPTSCVPFEHNWLEKASIRNRVSDLEDMEECALQITQPGLDYTVLLIETRAYLCIGVTP